MLKKIKSIFIFTVERTARRLVSVVFPPAQHNICILSNYFYCELNLHNRLMCYRLVLGVSYGDKKLCVINKNGVQVN